MAKPAASRIVAEPTGPPHAEPQHRGEMLAALTPKRARAFNATIEALNRKIHARGCARPVALR
jgi:hypothetical protein